MINTALFVKMVIDRWNGSIANLDKHLGSLTDEQLQKQVAPGKNRGFYLLGHFIAVHDEMLVLLGMGAKLYPELYGPFLKEPDNIAVQTPPVAALRKMWETQNKLIHEKFRQMNPEDWFQKHTAIADADFAAEPHRNKLNVVITRTSHLQYHTGQIVLLH
ncbi:DinB family protein [Panacibacter sp. DH6]|uniref:DinB family protein n=1 Tax=Panacibacter microcysteis TaxID=2793269 RepID=A0A931MCF5_9BACT|nr:DinB family protein [Panacibacter microcysteis]MBG9378081.1 DinB family protein [Panacibacter microcysteis]